MNAEDGLTRRQTIGGLAASVWAVPAGCKAQPQFVRMRIDPQNLDHTATRTFGDDFDTLSFYADGQGVWDTAYWWAKPHGATLINNAEMQWYLNRDFAPTSKVKPWFAEQGRLVLEAAPTPPDLMRYVTNYAYTSGMLTTYRSFAQLYGYFEMRAKLPKGKGLWPGFWLLPIDRTWPPELDIMEVLGSDPTMLVTTVHAPGAPGSKENIRQSEATKVADTSADFHVFGTDWQKDYITWYFDGRPIFQVATPSSMNKPMYVLVNLAVGGSWPGAPDASTQFPARYEIDYIRAYKQQDA
jgi:beta-glucanase (GH16 family)